MNFSICPHDTEKGLNFWKGFVKELEKKLGESINFEPFYSFEEEEKKLNSKIYHIYYARPEKAIWLYRKGYKPAAKFIVQEDVYFIISRDEKVLEKSYIKVATPLTDSLAYSFIGFEFEEIEVVITKDFKEVFQLVKEKKVDIGIMYNESWNEIEHKGGVKKVKESDYKTSHIFMIHPSIYDKAKMALLSFNFLEEVKEEDVLKLDKLFKNFELYSKRWQEHDIAKSILNIKGIGVVVYQEKIVFANDFAANLFGYSKEELYSKSILDLIYEEDRSKIKPIIEKRLKGKKFPTVYNEVKVVDKKNKLLILNAFGSTVLFKGKHSGFFTFIDITKHKKLERLYGLLREINNAITHSFIEEELFTKVCYALIKKVGLTFIWIGTKESDENPYFKILYKYGEDKGYLNSTKISWREDLPEGKGPAGQSFRTKKIHVVANTQTDPRFISPWREYTKERNFISIASIPIKFNNEVKYVITLYSPEPEFFEEETVSVLEELKSDIEFAIKKLYETRESIIIKEALEHSSSWVLITDENFNIVYVNDAVCNISGYSKEELIGKNPRIFKSGVQPDEFYKNLYKTIVSGKTFSGMFINKKKNGELFYLTTTVYPVKIKPNIKRFLAIGKDITKEIELQNEITKLQNYDKLTNLLNTEGFFLYGTKKLKIIKNYAVLSIIDLKDFTLINKAYSLDAGNTILKEIANRLSLTFPNAILGRSSADEFFILEEIDKNSLDKELFNFTEKIKAIFSKPIFHKDKLINIYYNAGISIYPEDGNSLKKLYENASTALIQAKRDRENEILTYSKDLEEKMKELHFAKKLVERALNENLFILFYQPFYNTKTLSLEGFEALIRIKDVDGKIYTPNTFIDVLESSKHLFDFENWLVNKIKTQCEKWNVPISFNISASGFKDDKHMKFLSSINFNIPAIMEITERILLEYPEKVKEILKSIKESTSLKIAIDDFGTEYSSLKYIKDLPIDEIKIDISFTKSMVENPKDKALVETIIELSKKLNLKTLAEGVETKQQLNMLKEMGCDYVQGFLLGKPMPEKEAETLLKNH